MDKFSSFLVFFSQSTFASNLLSAVFSRQLDVGGFRIKFPKTEMEQLID